MKKDDRVRNEGAPDWGLGRILEDPASGNVRIFFSNVGTKTVSLIANLVLVKGEEATNSVLDNLKIASSGRESSYKTLTMLKQQFLNHFPEGFHGKKYKLDERDYKVEAHELAKKLLRRELFETALRSKDFGELRENARKVMRATNLVFRNEKMNFSDGLKTLPFQKQFITPLYDLLYGDCGLERRFTAFCAALAEIGSAKWTVATYFPFIMYPDEYMFMKPEVTSKAADICAFELNYKPELNWLTYDKLLIFSQYLKKELSDLKPRDMIDVQSFIWCTGDGNA